MRWIRGRSIYEGGGVWADELMIFLAMKLGKRVEPSDYHCVHTHTERPLPGTRDFTFAFTTERARSRTMERKPA